MPRRGISVEPAFSARPGELVATRNRSQPMLRTARAVGYPVKRDPVAIVPDDLLAAEFTSPHGRRIDAAVRLGTPLLTQADVLICRDGSGSRAEAEEDEESPFELDQRRCLKPSDDRTCVAPSDSG